MALEVFHNFTHATLEHYEPHNDNQKRAKEVVGTYIDDLARNYELGRGMLLMGPYGVGKTMLANIILNEARATGYSTEAISLPEFFDVHYRLFKLGVLSELLGGDRYDQADRWEELTEHLEQLRRRTQFVLFDDVGKEYSSASGWTVAQFDYFLRARHVRGLPTLLTSNVPLTEWSIGDYTQDKKWTERYTEGMVSFLHEAMIIVPIDANDERL